MIGPTALCPQGIALILLDLDDTVVVDGTKITPRVLDAISLAREHGCMACVCTGRALHMVPALLTEPRHMDYLICANGACVYDTMGDVLYERLMTREQVLEAMDALEPLGAGWNAFVGGHSYFEWRSLSYMLYGRSQQLTGTSVRKALHTGRLYKLSRRAARFAKRLVTRREGFSQVRRVRPYVETTTEGIAKIGCSLQSSDACERAIATLEHLGHFEVARMSTTELEITAKGATKGVTARWLMDYLGVDPACAVAFGDSENDAPLIDAYGTFVAVDNADGRVKERAADVCESVYDDGVARWIERAVAEAMGARHVQS